MNLRDIYPSEPRETRPLMQDAEAMTFLVKANFSRNIEKIKPLFPKKLVQLTDIVYFLSDGQLDYMHIVSAGGREYLMDSSYELASEGYKGIMQLYGVTPYFPGYLVMKNDDNGRRLYGMIDHSGNETVPCMYYHLNLISARQIFLYDPEYKVGYSHREEDAMLLAFKNDDGVTVYDPEGNMLCRNIRYIGVLEERVITDHSHDWVLFGGYRKETTVQKLQALQMIYDPNNPRLHIEFWYTYDVLLHDDVAEITFSGVEYDLDDCVKPEWLRIPEKPLPDKTTVKLLRPRNEYPENDDLIAELLMRLTRDADIYDYVDPYEIFGGWNWHTKLTGEVEEEKEEDWGPEFDLIDDWDLDEPFFDEDDKAEPSNVNTCDNAEEDVESSTAVCKNDDEPCDEPDEEPEDADDIDKNIPYLWNFTDGYTWRGHAPGSIEELREIVDKIKQRYNA